MNKFKLFVENILVYGLGGVISKIIPLVMLPIVTRLMPDTAYFGLNDLVTTCSSFAGSVAILGMFDGMYRMFFEHEDHNYQKKVCSTTLIFTSISTVIVCILLYIFRNVLAAYVFKNQQYVFLVYLVIVSTLVSATNCIVSAPTRMQNNRKLYLITNTLSSILSYAVSIPLLVKGYYIIALPIAAIISGISLELIFGFINKKWFSITLFDSKILKDTLRIALPLFPNFLVYWVFNSSDRIMISNFASINDVGIYSIGAKLGHMSQLIYTAFSGGWLFFSFSTMKDKKQVENNSLIFEYMGLISYAVTSIVFATSYFIYKHLFEGEYVLGYIIAPYLFLAPLLQMLFQIECNQFVIVKKTWPNVLLLSLGAVSNIVLNIILIPLMGVEGAAIASLLGYIVTLVVTTIVLTKMKLIRISWKFYTASFLMLFYIIAWRFCATTNTLIGIGIMSILLLFFLLLYYQDLKSFIKMIKNRNRDK